MEANNESVFCAVGPHKDFVVFDVGTLSDEEVTGADLTPVRAANESPYRSYAWSSGVDWYFVVSDEGIALIRVSSGEGYLCRKKTWRFIEMFLDAPIRKRGQANGER